MKQNIFVYFLLINILLLLCLCLEIIKIRWQFSQEYENNAYLQVANNKLIEINFNLKTEYYHLSSPAKVERHAKALSGEQAAIDAKRDPNGKRISDQSKRSEARDARFALQQEAERAKCEVDEHFIADAPAYEVAHAVREQVQALRHGYEREHFANRRNTISEGNGQCRRCDMRWPKTPNAADGKRAQLSPAR